MKIAETKYVMHTILICCLMLTVSNARASSDKSPSITELTGNSDKILVGVVVDIEVGKKQNTNKIYTDVFLDDGEVVFNGKSKSLKKPYRIRILGGFEPIEKNRSGKTKYRIYNIQGTPVFGIGERVLVFLSGNGRSAVPMKHMREGVLKIGDDGQLYHHDGVPVIGIKDDQLIFDIPEMIPTRTETNGIDTAEFFGPSNETVRGIQNRWGESSTGRHLTTEELVEYVTSIQRKKPKDSKFEKAEVLDTNLSVIAKASKRKSK